MMYYRFTKDMTFLIDPKNKTITIKGSYTYQMLKDAMEGMLVGLHDYLIKHEEIKEVVRYPFNNE